MRTVLLTTVLYFATSAAFAQVQPVQEASAPTMILEKSEAWTPKPGEKYDFKAHPFPPEPNGYKFNPVKKGPEHHSWLDWFRPSTAEADQTHTTCTSYLYGRADGSHYWNMYCYNYNAYETSYAGSQTVYGSDTSGRQWTKTAFGTNGVSESIPYGYDQTCHFAVFPNIP